MGTRRTCEKYFSLLEKSDPIVTCLGISQQVFTIYGNLTHHVCPSSKRLLKRYGCTTAMMNSFCTLVQQFELKKCVWFAIMLQQVTEDEDASFVVGCE